MITSRTNDRIKYVEKLKEKTSFRREEGCFVVEGIRMIREVPSEQRKELYLTEKALEQYPELADWCDAVETVSESVMEKLADTITPQGMVAVVTMVGPSQRRLFLTMNAEFVRRKEDAPPPIYFVLDGVQDPGNVGTIIRTAEAVGAQGVLLGKDCADPYSPKVVRSTMGGIFRVPMLQGEILPLLQQLKKLGITICGTHLDGEEFYAADISGPIAFLIGSEGRGLSEEVAKEAQLLLRIPMEGEVESLNAAVSAAVVGYEAYRQRRVEFF